MAAGRSLKQVEDYPMLKSLAAAMLVAGMMVSSAALAKDKVEKVVVADTPARFAAVVEKVHHEMKVGGRYQFISATNGARVNTLLEQMASLLDANGSVAAMNDQDKIKLFNAQEQVNGILADNASDRLICRKVAPVGSHLPVTTCHTYGELARNRSSNDKTRRFLNQVGLGERAGFLNEKFNH
jgi:hypothetical protein